MDRDDRITLAMQLIESMPPEDQERIEACYTAIKAIMNQYGDISVFVLTRICAEAA